MTDAEVVCDLCMSPIPFRPVPTLAGATALCPSCFQGMFGLSVEEAAQRDGITLTAPGGRGAGGQICLPPSKGARGQAVGLPPVPTAPLIRPHAGTVPNPGLVGAPIPSGCATSAAGTSTSVTATGCESMTEYRAPNTLTALYRRGIVSAPGFSGGAVASLYVYGGRNLLALIAATDRWEEETGEDAWDIFVRRDGAGCSRAMLRRINALYQEQLRRPTGG